MPLDFTTVERVRGLLGESADDDELDALLASMISSVSARFEAEMRRHTETAERTEIYPTSAYRRMVSLKGAPVDMDTPPRVRLSSTMDFNGSPALTGNNDYILEPEIGVLRLLVASTRIVSCPHFPYYVEVTYTGGLAEDTDELLTAFPDLAMACDLQVAYLFRRRHTPGGNLNVGDSDTSFSKDYALLDDVRSAVLRYVRRVW